MAKIKWDRVPDFLVWNRVKSIRKSRDLTQAQAAVGIGIGIPTLYLIEQGLDDRTTDETKKKVAKFFRCDIDDIFPAEMIGNKPKVYPGEKTIVKLHLFTSSEGRK